MESNIPPGCRLDDIPAVNAPDGNQIADDLACWFQKACTADQKQNNRFPHVDVAKEEYRGGLVNLEIHLTGIDPDDVAALGRRLIGIGKKLMEGRQ